MKTAVIANCPGCKTKLKVSPSGHELTEVTCPSCKKHFCVRVNDPKNLSQQPPKDRHAEQARPVPQLDNLLAAQLPPMELSYTPQNVNWQGYRTRKPVPWKLIAICVGGSLSAVALIWVTVFSLQHAEKVDMGAVGSFLQGRPDNPDYLIADWNRYRDEQAKILAQVTRPTDCISLQGPLEQLVERYLELIARAATIDHVESPRYRVSDLPPFPSDQPSGERAFRAISAAMTQEFRETDDRAKAASEVLLRYFHSCVTTAPLPANDYERAISERIGIKRLVARLVANYRRGRAEENETSVAIYEQIESLKKIRDSIPKVDQKTASALPNAYRHNELLADQMLVQLTSGRAGDPESAIGKSLAVFNQVVSF